MCCCCKQSVLLSPSFMSVLHPHTRTASFRHLGDGSCKYVLYQFTMSAFWMLLSSSASAFDKSNMYLTVDPINKQLTYSMEEKRKAQCYFTYNIYTSHTSKTLNNILHSTDTSLNQRRSTKETKAIVLVRRIANLTANID